jgi:hypothetical protein
MTSVASSAGQSVSEVRDVHYMVYSAFRIGRGVKSKICFRSSTYFKSGRGRGNYVIMGCTQIFVLHNLTLSSTHFHQLARHLKCVSLVDDMGVMVDITSYTIFIFHMKPHGPHYF